MESMLTGKNHDHPKQLAAPKSWQGHNPCPTTSPSPLPQPLCHDFLHQNRGLLGEPGLGSLEEGGKENLDL